MASSREYLQFITGQLSRLEDVAFRSMMGEYIIYYRGKVAAYICDDRLLVKILPITSAMLPDARREPPYDGAKDMLLVEEVDDRAFLESLFRAMEPELPAQKPRKRAAGGGRDK